MQFSPKACQFLGAHYIRKWSRGRTRESKSGGKNERSILPERRQGFFRPCSYYLKFVPDFGKTAESQYSLMNRSRNFEWSTECKSAVTEVKKKLLEAPVLGYPHDRGPNTLTTDASLTRIGAILTQRQGTEDRVIEYASLERMRSVELLDYLWFYC